MRKPRLFVALLLVLFAGLCYGCVDKNQVKGENDMELYRLTLEEAEAINQNSHLGLEYMALSTFSEHSPGQTYPYGPDHPEMAFSEDGRVIGYYFTYPWDSQDYRLAQISIKVEGYDFYGIRIGDDISTVGPKMAELGYQLFDDPDYYPEAGVEAYFKYHVFVVFSPSPDSTVITSIMISKREPAQPVEIM